MCVNEEPMIKIGHSEFFQTTLVETDGGKCGLTKIANANEFINEHAQ